MITYDAEDVFELLICHDQHVTPHELLEIRKKGALKQAEELRPAPKERITAVLNLTEGLGLPESGIRKSEDIDWNEKRTATPGQGTVRMLAC